MKTQNRGRRQRLLKGRQAWHWVRVSRLRDFLLGRTGPYYYDLRDTPIRFSVREVADALGGSPKVISEAAHRRMIKPERLADKKARKLFFKREAVRRFVNGYRLPPIDDWLSRTRVPEEYSRVFRSEKIALNPHLVRGDAVTIERAMLDLRISRRGVQYYLKRGELKKIPCGYRTVLVTRKSLERLRRRRLAKHERQFEVAKKRLEKIRGCRIETEFVDRRLNSRP